MRSLRELQREFGIRNSECGISQTDSKIQNPKSKISRIRINNLEPYRALRYLFLVLGTGVLCASLISSVALAVEGDVVFKRSGTEGDTPPAMFPHWSHRIRYKCYACHNSLFQMKAGEDVITMDAIMEGKFCGACHNGTVAWPATFETCSRCHVQH